MKRIMTAFMMMLASASGTSAYTYTYGQDTNFGSLDLSGSQSVLVNGGGGDELNLFDGSSARIESTTHVGQPRSSGQGIDRIFGYGSSNLVVTGGEIRFITLSSYAHLTLSGGTITTLEADVIPPVPAVAEDKYIQILCKSWAHPTGDMVTGVWGNDSTFSIKLDNTSPWPSGFTYDSINFTIVPEPFSLALLALGGLLVRSRSRG
jgi:hypothetical protein